jgi:hypothetical protein
MSHQMAARIDRAGRQCRLVDRASEICMKRQAKAADPLPRSEALLESGFVPPETLPEIHAAFERVRGHAAKWLAERDTMAKKVAEYEALKSAQSAVPPHAGNDGDKI